jgi:glutaredoxin
MELKVFTLPSCPSCSMAKTIASEVADEFGLLCREVSLATKEGLNEGSIYDIMSTPSIVLDDDVIVRGRLISKDKLKAEIELRLQKWKQRASKEPEQAS